VRVQVCAADVANSPLDNSCSAPPSARIPRLWPTLTTKKENQARWKERMCGAAKLQSTTLSAFSASVTAVVRDLVGSGLDMVDIGSVYGGCYFVRGRKGGGGGGE